MITKARPQSTRIYYEFGILSYAEPHYKLVSLRFLFCPKIIENQLNFTVTEADLSPSDSAVITHSPLLPRIERAVPTHIPLSAQRE